MAYDEGLAERVRSCFKEEEHVIEKKMFGGICFLLHGNMAIGVHESELIVRLPADETDDALKEPGTRIFDLSGGRPMKGWLLVSDTALANEEDLARWIDQGRSYALTLPPK